MNGMCTEIHRHSVAVVLCRLDAPTFSASVVDIAVPYSTLGVAYCPAESPSHSLLTCNLLSLSRPSCQPAVLAVKSDLAMPTE